MPDDDGEQVVEVVRDAAGEPADRLHLLRLLELALGLLQLLVRPPGLVEQAAVLERDRRVRREGARDGEVLGGEALLPAGQEAEHADDPVPDPGRDGEEPW